MPHQDPAVERAYLDLLGSVSSPAYSVGIAIPPQKRNSARTLYQVDEDDEIKALVDTSLIGASQLASAKFGMAIGWFALYWRNPFYEPSPRTRLSWVELRARLPRIGVPRPGVISLGDDARFISSPTLDDGRFVALLRAIVGFWEKHPQADRAYLRAQRHAPDAAPAEVERVAAAQSRAYVQAGQAMAARPPSGHAARHDFYSQTLAQPYLAALTGALALWLTARDPYSYEELDAVVDFLRSDDSLPDTDQAIDTLLDLVRELNELKLKSVYRLPPRRDRILRDIALCDSADLRAGIGAIIDGLAELTRGHRGQAADAVYIDIKKALRGQA